jgi:hypothetical protein
MQKYVIPDEPSGHSAPATDVWRFGRVVSRGNHCTWYFRYSLGVTHGALARACHAAYEKGSSGKAWNRLRRPAGRLRRFVNLITLYAVTRQP